MTSADFCAWRVISPFAFLLWHPLIPPTETLQISEGKINRFQSMCSLHLHHPSSSSIGLWFDKQSHPMDSALYVVSVRWTRLLPTASFRFHFTMDTLAVWLTLPTTKRVRDFHPIAVNHASRTCNSSLSGLVFIRILNRSTKFRHRLSTIETCDLRPYFTCDLDSPATCDLRPFLHLRPATFF